MIARWIPTLGVFVFLIVSVLLVAWRARKQEATALRALRALGARHTLHLGICLDGLPGLRAAEEVLGGVTAQELLVVALEGREVGRIPWTSIRQVHSGVESTVEPLLSTGRTLPSLMLLASRPEPQRHSQQPPAYLVVSWENASGGLRQAVFQTFSTVSADILAEAIRMHSRVAALGRARG